ncbi:MAG: sterol desaturase family protein [Oligoflexia bacterium]|nr:sterol desaturase family protein [Oligoflexia bacterium]
MHWPLLYKKVHSIHYLSRQTTPLTSHSFHAVETLVNMSVVFLIPFIIPLHISAYAIFTTLAVLNNVYGHSGYEFWPKSWVLKFPLNLLNLPSVHSWHHEKVNGNFGLYTTIWDRLFGTYKKPF